MFWLKSEGFSEKVTWDIFHSHFYTDLRTLAGPQHLCPRPLDSQENQSLLQVGLTCSQLTEF